MSLAFVTPSVITGETLHPYLLYFQSKYLHIVELAVSFESNMVINAKGKRLKYFKLVKQLQEKYKQVEFVVCTFICALGLFDRTSDIRFY